MGLRKLTEAAAYSVADAWTEATEKKNKEIAEKEKKIEGLRKQNEEKDKEIAELKDRPEAREKYEGRGDQFEEADEEISYRAREPSGEGRREEAEERPHRDRGECERASAPE